MKKQILFLAFFTLALIFAGTISSFGQKNTDPKVWAAPTCGTTNEYYPAAGVEYTYSVAIGGTGFNGDGTFAWKITEKTDLFAASGVPATEYAINSGGGANDNNIHITWNASSVGKIYYVVVDYNEVNADGTKACDINNIKVFPVAPANAFWLDINASVDGTTPAAPSGTATFDVCAPDVSSAVITTPGNIAVAQVKYEFGVTKLYAIISAAGYTGNFDAVLTIAGLEANQTAVVTGWTAGTAVDPGNGTYTNTLASLVGGQNHTVEIVITNNQHETITDQPITISIDGTYVSNGVTMNDLSDANGNCTAETANADYIKQTVKARPTITPNNPPNFVTPAPALTD